MTNKEKLLALADKIEGDCTELVHAIEDFARVQEPVTEQELREWLSEQPYKASDLAKRLLAKFNISLSGEER